MTTHLIYRGRHIRIKPLILNGKLLFRIYINTQRTLDISSLAGAKRSAIKFIDSIDSELLTPDFSAQV